MLKANPPGETSFQKAKPEIKAARLEAVMRDYNVRLGVLLANFSAVRSREEFASVNQWSRKGAPLCTPEWLSINQIALQDGVYSKRYMTRPLMDQVELKEALWKQLVGVMTRWMPMPDFSQKEEPGGPTSNPF
jgi:hypothetical protein